MVHFNTGRRTCYGQATLEYALVTSALLAVLIAFGVMFHVCSEGVLVHYALEHVSHRMHVEDDGTVSVLCY